MWRRRWPAALDVRVSASRLTHGAERKLRDPVCRQGQKGNRRVAEQVVIIGSGPAGWSAAIYAARAALNPLVFEGAITEENRLQGTLPLGQLALTTEVENYAGFPAGRLDTFLSSALDPARLQGLPGIDEHVHAVTGPELMELMRQQAVNFGTRIITDDVVDVDLESRPFRVMAREGETIETHTLIVATGARANYLGLPSEERFKNRGVSACAVCDGALPRFRQRPLVVVGGGDSAIEEATHLAKYAARVSLVHRRDALRASRIMQQRAFDNPKIEIVWNHVVDEVLGTEDDGVTAVRLRSTVADATRELPCSGLFLAIGHTPNTSFLRGKLDTTDKGYIRWTAAFRTSTSVPGVFAAGDVADDYYRQAITSAGTGCMAALDAERYLVEQNL
jgi:thioredoxin reductase (NADPH)